ncbi:LCP family protein [Jeotgalibacillus proteolyticus]|uniref:Transcriptional regulator n=1 Tax=Jeotgalibacillus proteolyticus TaxID=2082395 RepID=A0A2S5GBA1_9BACL|nr:LCP family protein [Jeotgalibacillus proteolyticus]PPA70269.1 transcriptional regulator [Jeotgalibacillus proteolyticus]
MNRSNYRKKTARKRMRKRFLLFMVLPLFILGGTAVVYGTHLFKQAESAVNDSYDNLNRESSELRENIPDPDFDNISILFMGVDASEKREENGFTSDNSRTDALVLATLNNKEKSINLLSIPRDTLAYIPHVDYKDKINHAHAFGGPQAAMESVESLLEVPVDYYVRMNFNAFIDVVNSLDGVKVNVPYELKEQDSRDKKNAIHLMPGIQTLDGEEALAFARTRHYDSDIERGKRQVEVIEAILDKSTSISSISKYSDVIQAVGQNLKTNLTFDEMKSFISYAANSELSVNNLSLYGEETYIEGIYYYRPDEYELWSLQEKLQVHLGLIESETTTDLSLDNQN